MRKEDRTEVNINDILSAGNQLGAFSDVWVLWTDEKDYEIFYLKCLGKKKLWKVSQMEIAKEILNLKNECCFKSKTNFNLLGTFHISRVIFLVT